MKKAYEAPEIVFEDFSLSTNIAGDCGTIVGNQSYGVCAYRTRTGLDVFTDEMVNVCTTHDDDGEYDGFCYHVPIEAKSLFNS